MFGWITTLTRLNTKNPYGVYSPYGFFYLNYIPVIKVIIALPYASVPRPFDEAEGE